MGTNDRIILMKLEIGQQNEIAGQTSPFGARARRKEGVWGRNSAAPEPKRSPAALLIQSRSQQKSFLDLLEEEIGGARKSEIEKKTFLLAGERQRAAAWRSVKRSAQSRFGFGHIIAHAKQKYGLEAVFFIRAGNGIRTRDLLLGKETFCC